MKKPYDENLFNKIEIEILKKLVHSSRSVSELGKLIGKSHSTVSVALKRLQKKELITMKRNGSKKIVEFDNSKHAILLRNLFAHYNEIPWEKLLSNSSFNIIRNMLESKKNIKKSESEITIWRHLRNLMAHGVITIENNNYRINPRFVDLNDYFKAYNEFLIQQQIKKISNQAIIIWKNSNEFLIRIPYSKKIEKEFFHLTAISVFSHYGIDIISGHKYYYSSKKPTLDKGDYLLHTLLIEKRNVIYITYALLFMQKFYDEWNKSRLLKKAEKYGLKKQVNAMLLFLAQKRTPVDVILPTWQEYKEKVGLYGIKKNAE